MAELINVCFKGGEKQFLVVTDFGAIWTNNKNKFEKTFKKDSLNLAITFSNMT